MSVLVKLNYSRPSICLPDLLTICLLDALPHATHCTCETLQDVRTWIWRLYDLEKHFQILSILRPCNPGWGPGYKHHIATIYTTVSNHDQSLRSSRLLCNDAPTPIGMPVSAIKLHNVLSMLYSRRGSLLGS